MRVVTRGNGLLAGGLALILCACSSSSELSIPRVDSPRAGFNSALLSTRDGVVSVRKSDGTQVEVESSVAEEMRLIQAQPTSFEMRFPDATYGWERAKMFFLRFTSQYEAVPPEGLPLVETGRGRGGAPSSIDDPLVMSNLGATSDRVLFEVRKRPSMAGLSFTVSARPHPLYHGRTASPQKDIDFRLQAQNLARFITNGSLRTEVLSSSAS